jgi:hypothetical protein
MTIFESKAAISRPVNEVYTFLADLNNHRQLMGDNVQDWVSTIDTAIFNIQNMAKLSLKVENRVENKEITIIPSEKPPFDLVIKWELSSVGENTEALMVISAKLNTMLKMIASGPLQKLADYETQTLVSLLG